MIEIFKFWVSAIVVERVWAVWDFLLEFLFGFKCSFDLFGLGVVE
jgi:hypothetical protein